MQKWLNPSGTPTYFSWRNMRARCYNSNDISYKNYGARGIVVCDKWREDFDAFIADMGECPFGWTLERANSNGNYELENCRWATYAEQGINRRNNTIVEFEGRSQVLAEWARELEVSSEVLIERLKRLPLQRAMTKGLFYNTAKGAHGTISTYVGKRCRCDLCKKAASTYKKAEYQRKKLRNSK